MAMTTQDLPPFLRGLTLSRDFAGYAVPLTDDSQVVGEVLAGARRDLPVIGFSWQIDYKPGHGPHDLGPRPGPIVHRVARGGPADAAGLRSMGQQSVTNPDGSVGIDLVADVIVALDGVPTPTFYDLLALVKTREIGDVVTLTVQRDNATFRLDLELGAKSSVFASN
jgi:S1-C subfamily serine protease